MITIRNKPKEHPKESMMMVEKRPQSKDSVILSKRFSKESPKSSLRRMTFRPTLRPNLKLTTS